MSVLSGLPVSVIIVTRNEAQRISSCIESLSDFDEIIVVDSQSTDETVSLARQAGAQVIDFEWNGAYPKKRQWCLDHVSTKHDWIFFVDADERVTKRLVGELRVLFRDLPDNTAGFFVKGRYIIGGHALRYGVKNNKLCLLHRHRMMFPVVDDLDLPGMGEIEGHYQPILRQGYESFGIGQIATPLEHHAYRDRQAWEARHQRYAAWERGMNRKNAWPGDPVKWRQGVKRLFRAMPGRPLIAFIHSYIYKLGCLDGRAGLRLALDRYRYYRMISGPQNTDS